MDEKVLIISANTMDDMKNIDVSNADYINVEYNLQSGGNTPTFDFISLLTFKISKPVIVTIKPEFDSYIVNSNSFNKAKQVIELIKGTQIIGFKWGGLNPNGTINEDALKEVINIKGNLLFFMSRAIDSTRDYKESIETLKKYSKSIDYITTSGGAETARDGLYNISWASKIFKNKIIAGSRININNIDSILETKNLRGIHVYKGAKINNNFLEEIDVYLINKMKDKLKNIY